MKKATFLLAGVLTILFCLQASSGREQAQTLPSGPSGAVTPSIARVDADYGKIPLQFIPNKGQMDGQVAYYVQGRDKSIYFTSEGLTYVLRETPRERGKNRPGPREHSRSDSAQRWVVKLDFVNSNPDAELVGLEKSGAVISYFKGKPEEWKAGLPAYSKIEYRELWPGIDLVYSGTFERMKYEFVVHPGADPSLIKLAYRGADKVALTDEGRLKVKTPTGGFEDDTPIAYQEADGKRVTVPVGYDLKVAAKRPASPIVSVRRDVSEPDAQNGEHVYGFTVGAYDRSRTLVLDPAVLVYCGYIGGSGDDEGYGIAVDSSGNAYITGSTYSTESTFPETGGPDLDYNGLSDAFVAKVNAAGTALVYCGYIGGAGNDEGYGIAIDNSGNAYVTGYTTSAESTFPVTVGPDLTHNGLSDAFVAKVNAAGTALVYCGYIGGTLDDEGYGIAVDASGNAYVTGYAKSTESSFPKTGGPDVTHNGLSDAFVAKVDAYGTGLVYCGYIGGSGDEEGYGITVDASGNAYITGYTQSSESTFPKTVGPDLTYNGDWDAFVAKVNAFGTTLVYCGYIGGSGADYGYGIAVDGSGNAYVTGATGSVESTFPVTGGPDLISNGGSDAFVAKVKADGTALVYCGYIGGSGSDYGYGIAVDSSGNAYITGATESTESTFPVTGGPDLTYNGGVTYGDALVAKVCYSMHADFNRDGQEDILWRCYGSGAYQGWNLVWYMNQSGTLSAATVATSLAETAGLDAPMGPRPAIGYLTPLEAGNSQITSPSKSYESPMGAGRPLALKPAKVMRHPMEIGRNLAPRSKGRVVDEDVVGLPNLKSATRVSNPMSGGTVKMASLDQNGQAVLSTIQDTTWEIAGSGDFDGNGTTDILWRCYGSGPYQGWNVIWYMKGTTVTNQGLPNVVYDTNWRIDRTGDFDGDGTTDILWRYYGTGTYQGWNVIWYMNGATIKSQGFPNAVLDTNWKVDGVGDFDGDGKTDILWRYYGTGTYQGWNIIWYMNGTTIKSQGFPNVVSDTNWKVDGTGDFDGDGKADVLWRNYGSGTYQGWNILWYMNGATIKSQEVLKTISDTNWRIANR